MSDPYVGKLTYFRVYSGQIKAGDRVLNTTNGKTERIGRILQMHANHREERDEIGAGEIAAAVGLKFTTTGDTLAVDSAPIVLERMSFPDPVISVAIEPQDEGRPGQARDGARSASPRRIRPSASRPTRRPGRRSSRGWASCTSRSSSTACSASSAVDAQRRPPAGRLPRDDHEPGREDPGQVRPPDRRLGPVRRRRHQPLSEPRRGLRVRRQDRRRARSRRSTSRRSTRASRRR